VGFIDTSGSIAYTSYKIPNNGDLTDTFFLGINNAGEVVGTYANVAESSSLVSLLAGLACLTMFVKLSTRQQLERSGPQ
jgi:hypothetical protein